MQVLEFMMEKLCNVCFIRILTVTYSTHHATILLTAVIGEIKKNIEKKNQTNKHDLLFFHWFPKHFLNVFLNDLDNYGFRSDVNIFPSNQLIIGFNGVTFQILIFSNILIGWQLGNKCFSA